MEIHYQEHGFDFDPLPGQALSGRLVLDEARRELLARLVAAEDDDWYLDEEGERRPPEELFSLSPWSCPGPAGTIKLLCRFLDLRDGSARFNTPELYLGELFRWVRSADRSRDIPHCDAEDPPVRAADP